MTGQDLVPIMASPLDRIREWSAWLDTMATTVDQRQRAKSRELATVTVLTYESPRVVSDLRKHETSPAPVQWVPTMTRSDR